MDYEIKQLSFEEAINYKYQIGKMLLDLKNEQLQYEPSFSIRRKVSEKEFLKVWEVDSFGDIVNYYYNKKSVIIVAIDNNNILGIIILTIREYEEHGKYEGNIPQLFVNKKYRRLGIAKALMSAGLEYYKNRNDVNGVFIGMMSKNKNAIKLYESFGFKERIHEARGIPI